MARARRACWSPCPAFFLALAGADKGDVAKAAALNAPRGTPQPTSVPCRPPRQELPSRGPSGVKGGHFSKDGNQDRSRHGACGYRASSTLGVLLLSARCRRHLFCRSLDHDSPAVAHPKSSPPTDDRHERRNKPSAHAPADAPPLAVQGANKGIGLAVVERILAERPEAVVLLGSRDPSRGKAAAEALAAKHPGRVEALQIDVSSDESVAAAARAVEAKLGKGGLFGLVNNAGIYSAVPGECVSTNLKGVKRVTDAFAPLLAADGRVVNVSSGAGPSFVSGCSDDRRRFFLRKDATFDEVRAPFPPRICPISAPLRVSRTCMSRFESVCRRCEAGSHFFSPRENPSHSPLPPEASSLLRNILSLTLIRPAPCPHRSCPSRPSTCPRPTTPRWRPRASPEGRTPWGSTVRIRL